MIFLYITLVVFMAFVLFQTLYIIIPLFKNEENDKKKITKNYSFSVIVPAYNEEKVIQHCISGFSGLKYKNAELIIVNDGSTDNTFNLLKSTLKLKRFTDNFDDDLKHQKINNVYVSRVNPNIFVIDKVNGGKADALNAGINFSINDIVITLDADSSLGKDSLNELNSAFQDNNVVACGGNVLIAQGFKEVRGKLKPTFKIKGIIRYQFLQYLTAFYLHKRTQVSLRAITVIAGAFGAFRREILLNINGFRITVGEDMDITLKLHKWIKENGGKKRIAFAPAAVSYTECPSTFKDLFKQRVRWQKAFIDCLLYYRKSYFSKFSARFSIFFLVDQFMIGTVNAFPVVATPIVLIFYDGHLILLLLFGLSAVTLFMYQSITTIYISSVHGIKFSKADIVRVILFLPIELLVFRMMNLCFVIYGTVTYFHRSQSWNKVERTGDFAKIRVKGT